MLNIKVFKQSKGFCGPCSLKIVLHYYGLDVSESFLARITKTSRITGCDEIFMAMGVKKLGFDCIINKGSTIDEIKKYIKKDIPVIVDWFSPEAGGHYSVVAGFRRERVFLADPHYGKMIAYRIKWFQDRWFDISHEKIVPREMIIVKRK